MKKLFLLFLLLIAASCAPRTEKTPESTFTARGTIKHVPFEGGFYGIEGDDGERYDPISIPEEFLENGMRVKFKARKNDGLVSIHMWGHHIELIEIKKA